MQQMCEIVKGIIFYSALLICAYKDIRKQEISVIAVIIGIIGIGMINIFSDKWSLSELFYSMIPGICLVGFTILTEGKIGMGDGLVSIMGGLYFGLYNTLEWLFFSFIGCAVFGIVLMTALKKSRKTEVAFVPFLFITGVLIH